MLVDCHVHLDPFSDEEVDVILHRAREVGVKFVISAGTTLASCQRSLHLSAKFSGFFTGIGLHPMNLEKEFTERTYEELKSLAISSTKVLAISEIGLDFMEGAPDRSMQYNAFRQQIRLARDLKLPIIFHSREAHDEVFRILKEERAYEVGGIMHYFQGTQYDADRIADLDFYISLARPLLRLHHLQEVATKTPLSRIVLETDSAPQPFKKKRENWTEPRHTRAIAEKLAHLKRCDVSEIEKSTTANMKTLLGNKWSLT